MLEDSEGASKARLQHHMSLWIIGLLLRIKVIFLSKYNYSKHYFIAQCHSVFLFTFVNNI